MNDVLLLSVRKFLESKVAPQKKLLLGYSGGPDSKALLYLLLECRRFFPFELHLAHVDHGWRSESKEEVVLLQKEADELGLSFHLKVLEGKDFVKGSLEGQARELRLKFFSKIYHDVGCQALLLGHHADDQAEVILKRVFEGASLHGLGGLQSTSCLQTMTVLRPLLNFSKKTILEWLHKKGLTFFLDPTNSTSQNLRGKMRQEIAPLLSQVFGKEIASNLCHLGEESSQLKEYFLQLNQPLLAVIQENPCGFQLPLAPHLPLPEMQMKYLIRECATRRGIVLSRSTLQGILDALLEKTDRKTFQTPQGEFEVRRGCLCFCNN